MNPAANLADQIRSGDAPQNLREFAAQGLVPLPEEELVPLQVFLLKDSQQEIAAEASAALTKVSEELWIRLVDRKEPDPAVIEYVLTFKPEAEAVKERILLNHSVDDTVFRTLGASESGRLVDVILNNHVRLLRDSEILLSLESNPNLTADQKRRIEEFKTEFIYKKQKVAESQEVPLVSLDDLLAQIPNLDLEALKWIKEMDAQGHERPSEEQVEQTLSAIFPAEEIGQLPNEIVSVYKKILGMSHSEKVRVALLGGREERSLLIRDASRQIASLVLRNPRITDAEMDGYAQMRNIDSDLLRQMGSSRGFIKRYSVIHALVRNPKTPSPTALNLLKLLREADLKNLERDKSIPDIIRRQAKKFKEQREVKRHN
ncbi:MAG TPA: hypothetical protein VLR94_11810 [Acidobacteriota bacterium]|nr:hypothetical protein [Acidobacteriota bacterium]